MSVVTLRGNHRPNLDFSSFKTKTRNGSVKGWVSCYYSTIALQGTLSNNVNLDPCNRMNILFLFNISKANKP
jgi:hypothetical protein